MAINSVGTPRFYISWGDWWKSLGANIPTWNTIKPQGTYPLSLAVGGNSYHFPSALYSYPPSLDSWKGINWAACLNHNLKEGVAFVVKQHPDTGTNFMSSNSPASGANCPAEYSGFSLLTDSIDFTAPESGFRGELQTGILTSTAVTNETEGIYNIACIVYGGYFDMSHAADLNLTITREYSGVKTIETKSGASLSNDFGSSPAKWGERAAWQIGEKDFSTGGRRIWSLSFSFLSESSVFPDNPTAIADTGGWEVDDTTPDFMSEVVKKTRGSMLPFIFQPDKDNDSEFAICKFDQNSFSFQQTAPNLYSVKMKIREVW